MADVIGAELNRIVLSICTIDISRIVQVIPKVLSRNRDGIYV